MRWMWIDRVVELIPRERLVAIKNVSLAEEHLHDHFAAVVDERGAVLRPATPVMPASLIIEGMAQTGGILVGHAEDFREKVILAKVGKAHLERDATPGCQLRYTAEIKSFSEIGASISGTVELAEPTTTTPTYRTIGSIELIFSHLDRNMAGVAYPEHNFVFGEGFKTLLRTSGVID
jgi:3-hydroxyacyl-[acyl-carrier-protein] dehydratase